MPLGILCNVRMVRRRFELQGGQDLRLVRNNAQIRLSTNLLRRRLSGQPMLPVDA